VKSRLSHRLHKAEGTTGSKRRRQKLGSIDDFLVGKRSGKAQYAKLQVGGLVGLGSDHCPLPGDMLTCETEQGG
jgi:hypothetical protein